jgi:hypothetical protein
MAKERESFNAREGKIVIAKEKERALVEGRECAHPPNALQQKGERKKPMAKEKELQREGELESFKPRKRKINKKKERKRKNFNMKERES